jgi:archaetidylinositol phosphate synthase
MDGGNSLSTIIARPNENLGPLGRAIESDIGPEAGILRTSGRADRTIKLSEFRDALRVQQSILAPLEGKCLVWLARHTPASVSPDHLTLLGLAAHIAGGVCYALSYRWRPLLLVANLFIFLNWFGDSLDGTLARFRNRQRPRYGFYVDHITDTFGAFFLICGLGISGLLSPYVAVAMLVGFLMLSVNVYLATYTVGTFNLSIWKMSPTEMRVLLAAGNVAAFYHPVVTVFGFQRPFFDVGGAVGSAAMAVILIVSVVRNTVILYRAESYKPKE